MQKRFNQQGFTLVELLLATAVFSVMLTICAVALIQINRQYMKSKTITKAQAATRSVVDEIERQIQLTNAFDFDKRVASGSVGDYGYFCIGSVAYYFRLGVRGAEETANTHVFTRIEHDGDFCDVTVVRADPLGDAIAAGYTITEMIEPTVSLHKVEITRDPAQIEVWTAAGPINAIHNPAIYTGADQVRCMDGVDSYYCGFSKLNVVINKRIF